MNKQYIRTVSVVFQADLLKDNPRTYTYLVPPTLRDRPDLTPGSLAVVFVRERYECVSIIGMDPPLDPNAKYEYKSIIDIVTKHPAK